MELSQLDVLAAVARHGGFAPAARERGVATSSVTRAVAALEASLGVRLLHRTTRRVALTETGERFLARVAPALEELAAARLAASEAGGAPTGTLRLAASVSYGQLVIAPRLAAFKAIAPGVTVDLILSDERVDLVAERIDLAVRHGRLADSGLVARRLRGVTYRLVASPAYLAEAGTLEAPDDLANHRAVSFDFAPFRDGWRLTRGDAEAVVLPPPAVLSSNALALRTCALDGMGVALLADWLVGDDLSAGRLALVLPGWTAVAVGADPDPALWLVMPSRAFVPGKVRAMEGFLRGG